MEVKVNDYIKLVEDLDCGLAELHYQREWSLK